MRSLKANERFKKKVSSLLDADANLQYPYFLKSLQKNRNFNLCFIAKKKKKRYRICEKQSAKQILIILSTIMYKIAKK